jgi:uncharacterized protein YfaS (alpha-2-macroglobulin family)
VPDYFDGTLTIMAVAFASDSTGSGEKESTIRGPFVITPSVPTMVAPNDKFEVGVTVANNIAGSGENAAVTLTAEPSAQLEIVQGPAMPLHVAEGRESTVTFSVHVKDDLGAASLAFHASAPGGETPSSEERLVGANLDPPTTGRRRAATRQRAGGAGGAEAGLEAGPMVDEPGHLSGRAGDGPGSEVDREVVLREVARDAK